MRIFKKKLLPLYGCWIDQQSYTTSGSVSTWMGERLRASKSFPHLTSHQGHSILLIPS